MTEVKIIHCRLQTQSYRESRADDNSKATLELSLGKSSIHDWRKEKYELMQMNPQKCVHRGPERKARFREGLGKSGFYLKGTRSMYTGYSDKSETIRNSKRNVRFQSGFHMDLKIRGIAPR